MIIHNKIEERHKNLQTNNPDKLMIHHTGGTQDNPMFDTSHLTFDAVRAYHLSLSWQTIGYHFFIEKDGKITQGRPVTMEGAHCRGQNRTSIGICLAGNFNNTLPTQEQEKSLAFLVEKLKKEHNITEVRPHRAYANTDCYGTGLADNWAEKLTTQPQGLEQYSIDELFEEIKKRIMLSINEKLNK